MSTVKFQIPEQPLFLVNSLSRNLNTIPKPRRLKKKGIPAQGLILSKSKYTMLRAAYLRSQYQSVESILKHIQNFCPDIRLKHPMFTLLRVLSQTLLLNSFEWLVLGYWLTTNPWRVDSCVVEKFRLDFPEVVFVSDAAEDRGLRSLTLWMFLVGYTLKQSITEDPKEYRGEIRRIAPKFQRIWREWMNQQDKGIVFESNAKILNGFFKKVSQYHTSPDYNMLVDQIIHISPAYLSEKQKPNNIPLHEGFLQQTPIALRSHIYSDLESDLMEELLNEPRALEEMSELI